jgi:sugar transferase (PEP-CTERM system associated)
MIRVFQHHFNASVIVQMIFDFAVVALALASFGALFLPGSPELAVAAPHGFSLAAGTFVVGNATGIYSAMPSPSLQQRMTRALVALLILLPLAYALFALTPQGIGHDTPMAFAAMGTVVAVVVHRALAGRSARIPALHSRVLVLGTGPMAQKVAESLRASDPHAEIVGFVPSPNETEHSVPAARMLTPARSLAETAANARVDEVVVALTERRSGAMSLRELLDCKISGIRVSDISSHFERRLGQINLDYVNAGWLIFNEGFNQGTARTTIKRVFDLLCAALLLLVTLPAMILTALAIKLESRGPVFYLQERVGLDGRTFKVIKFRSMRTDAEQDGKPRWATAHDDRVTGVGRFIRRVRIDEFPQLWNVFKGEMSMVGPRPERPFFVESLTKDIPYYAIRHSVKPGVTGWAQVRYEYGATVEDAKQKLQYDLYYVKNHTLFLDLLVMLETVSVVLTGKGAR